MKPIPISGASGRGRDFRLWQICCKRPKLPGANFLAVKKSDRRPPIDVAPITLPRPPASLLHHIFTRKSRVQPKEILITSAKRLLQQNRPACENPHRCRRSTAAVPLRSLQFSCAPQDPQQQLSVRPASRPNGPSLTASENLHRTGHCNTIGETLNPSHRSALDLGCKEKDRLAAVSPKSELGVLVSRMREHRKPSASCATSRADHRLPKSRRAVLPRRWGPAQRRIPRCSPAGRQC